MADGRRMNQLIGVATLMKSVEQQEHNLGAFGTRLDKKLEAIFCQLKELKTSIKKSPPPAEPIHQWGESFAYNKNRGHQGEYNNSKHKEVEIQQSLSRDSRRYHKKDHTAWRYGQQENFQDQHYYDNSSPWRNHQEDHQAWKYEQEDHYQDRQFHETSNEWQRQQEIQQKEYKWYQETQQKLQEEHQYEYRRTQEEKHGYLKALDNLIELLGEKAKQELAQEEERNEQIKEPEENIQEQSSFEVEREIYTSYGNTGNDTLNHQPFDEIPQPSHMESSILECIGEEIISVMSPISICKLLGHAETEAFLDDASCTLDSKRSNFNISTVEKDDLVGWLSFNNSDSEEKPLGWPEILTLMGKTKLKVVLQIRRSFMFQYSTKNGVNVVVFKHHWRWKITVRGSYQA